MRDLDREVMLPMEHRLPTFYDFTYLECISIPIYNILQCFGIETTVEKSLSIDQQCYRDMRCKK